MPVVITRLGATGHRLPAMTRTKARSISHSADSAARRSSPGREQHFGSTANTGAGANDADPDNDGVDNIVEHALLSDPHSDSQSGLPAGQAQDYVEGKRLTLQFDHSAERSDITIFVEANDKLDGTWTELACSVHGAAFTGPGTVSETTPIPGGTLRRVTVRDVENIDTNARRFTRVRVVADQ